MFIKIAISTKSGCFINVKCASCFNFPQQIIKSGDCYCFIKIILQTFTLNLSIFVCLILKSKAAKNNIFFFC